MSLKTSKAISPREDIRKFVLENFPREEVFWMLEAFYTIKQDVLTALTCEEGSKKEELLEDIIKGYNGVIRGAYTLDGDVYLKVHCRGKDQDIFLLNLPNYLLGQRLFSFYIPNV